ncbi:MAG: glycosyltransferase, partial [Phycisphaerae bacterium]|nr:glycosyltransferase [Phycisphaerae bacterium]
PSTAVKALRWLERRLVPRCDLVITVGNRLAEHYRKMEARKVVVVGNWKDPADFKFPPDTISRTRRELGLPNGVIAICFVANLGPERRLEPLLAAVTDDKRFACVIGGDGPQVDLVRQYAENYDNITYLGRVAPGRVPLITAACDVVYYGFDETNPNAQWSAPNKLYEAIAAGKPVLTGDFGEIGQVVRKERCGVIGNLGSSADLAHALASLTKPGELKDLGSRAVQAGRLYSRKQAIVMLLNAYESIAKSAQCKQRKNACPILKGT